MPTRCDEVVSIYKEGWIVHALREVNNFFNSKNTKMLPEKCDINSRNVMVLLKNHDNKLLFNFFIRK